MGIWALIYASIQKGHVRNSSNIAVKNEANVLTRTKQRHAILFFFFFFSFPPSEAKRCQKLNDLKPDGDDRERLIVAGVHVQTRRQQSSLFLDSRRLYHYSVKLFRNCNTLHGSSAFSISLCLRRDVTNQLSLSLSLSLIFQSHKPNSYYCILCV